MKATPFATRRLPRVGDLIYDSLRGGIKVRVISADHEHIMVSGTGGSYGRHPRYFSW